MQNLCAKKEEKPVRKKRSSKNKEERDDLQKCTVELLKKAREKRRKNSSRLENASLQGRKGHEQAREANVKCVRERKRERERKEGPKVKSGTHGFKKFPVERKTCFLQLTWSDGHRVQWMVDFHS